MPSRCCRTQISDWAFQILSRKHKHNRKGLHKKFPRKDQQVTQPKEGQIKGTRQVSNCIKVGDHKFQKKIYVFQNHNQIKEIYKQLLAGLSMILNLLSTYDEKTEEFQQIFKKVKEQPKYNDNLLMDLSQIRNKQFFTSMYFQNKWFYSFTFHKLESQQYFNIKILQQKQKPIAAFSNNRPKPLKSQQIKQNKLYNLIEQYFRKITKTNYLINYRLINLNQSLLNFKSQNYKLIETILEYRIQMSNKTIVNKQECTKKFINNLDLLIGYDDKHLYGKIDQRNVNKLIQEFPIIDEEGQKFSIFTSIEKFRIFAPGVYLMFKLLKYLIILFVVLSFFSFIQTLFLLKSPFYKGYQDYVRINMLRLTIASLQPEDYNVYIGFDVLITLITTCFLVYWSQFIRKFSKKCNQNINLPSYLTVQLKNVDEDFSQKNLKEFLIQKQKVIPHQIYTARNYGRFLKHYKSLTQTAIDLRIRKQLFENQQQQNKKKDLGKQIIQKLLQLREKYCSIKSQKFNQKKYRPKQVFIVLQSYKDRQLLLSRSNKNYLPFIGSQKRETNAHDFHFKPCRVQPQAIAWQNLGISLPNYLSRALLVFFILSCVTLLGIFLIFILQILQTAAIGDAYHFSQQMMKVQSYLLKGSSQNNCKQGEVCRQHADYAKLFGLILLTPISIFICKKCIMALLSHFVHFRKYPSQVSRIKSQIITLTIFYFFVIGILHLIMYLKLSNGGSLYEFFYPIIAKIFNITNFNPSSIHLYTDYSLDWYKQATFFIVIIGSMSFNLSNFVKFLLGLISYKFQVRKARKQKTAYGVNKALVGVNLHMQHIYASMIVIIYFALLYNCPIPLTNCFALFNLLFLFFIVKWTFIKYGEKPLRMGHSINRTVTNLLFIGVIIHCIMAPIFLGAQGIAQNNSHFAFKPENQNQIDHVQVQTLTISQRFRKFGPFYITLAVLILLYVLMRKPVNQFIVPIIKQKIFKKNSQQVQFQKEHFGLYPSYSMHNSPKYSQIMKNVYLLNKIQAKRSTCPIPRTLKKVSTENKLDTDYLAFDQILQIGKTYLDKQKDHKIYEQLLELQKLNLQSCIPVSSQIQQERQTDDRINVNYGLNDEIIENTEKVASQKEN